MMNAERHKLLFGPYKAPALRRGDRATCLFRDGDVIITGWSDGRTAWPRCQRPGQQGGSGLLVDAELVRAIKTESSAAIQYWWGVQGETVWRWKRFFGVGRWEPKGSRRLLQMNSQAGADAVKRKKWTKAERARRRAAALARGARPDRWKYTGWTGKQLTLLGTLPDEEVAGEIGRTANAVRIMRTRLGIPSARDRRRR
jgi:hypothetical protein